MSENTIGMTDNDVTAAALYQHGAALVPHVFEL